MAPSQIVKQQSRNGTIEPSTLRGQFQRDFWPPRMFAMLREAGQ
jgi:hypothetical protein